MTKEPLYDRPVLYFFGLTWEPPVFHGLKHGMRLVLHSAGGLKTPCNAGHEKTCVGLEERPGRSVLRVLFSVLRNSINPSAPPLIPYTLYLIPYSPGLRLGMGSGLRTPLTAMRFALCAMLFQTLASAFSLLPSAWGGGAGKWLISATVVSQLANISQFWRPGFGARKWILCRVSHYKFNR